MITELKDIKPKLKGHFSFQLREGWIRKGLDALNDDKNIFSKKEEAIDTLGVGSQMVPAIRYWLLTSNLVEEARDKNKPYLKLTEGFGEILNEQDPYFEEMSSLWLIHYQIVKNYKMAFSWYLFFNEIKFAEFNKEELYNGMLDVIHRVTSQEFSESSLKDDCDCIIKTYYRDKNEERDPEDNLISPLTELNLIQSLKYPSGKVVFTKARPEIDKLNKFVVLYVMLDNLNKKDNSANINDLLNAPCNVGKVFNLDRNILNEYLDLLKNDGFIEINRTAGLDNVYFKMKDKKAILLKGIKRG